MGEAKRRQKQDPTYGWTLSRKAFEDAKKSGLPAIHPATSLRCRGTLVGFIRGQRGAAPRMGGSASRCAFWLVHDLPWTGQHEGALAGRGVARVR